GRTSAVSYIATATLTPRLSPSSPLSDAPALLLQPHGFEGCVSIRVGVPLVHQLASEPKHVCQGKLDRHTTTSGATTQAHENHDLRARIEELLRHGLDVVEDIENLLDTARNPLAPEVGALPDLGLHELDVRRQKLKVDLLAGVESRVDRFQQLHVLLRHRLLLQPHGFQRFLLAVVLHPGSGSARKSVEQVPG